MSIQDFLVQQGYTINSLDETFSKWMSGWRRVEIPFSALVGHTLESFQRMAKEKGWIEEEKPQDFFDEPLAASGVIYGIFLHPDPGSSINTGPTNPTSFTFRNEACSDFDSCTDSDPPLSIRGRIKSWY